MRLIDADALKAEMQKNSYSVEFCREHNIDYAIDLNVVLMTIDAAQTVDLKDIYPEGHKEIDAMIQFVRTSKATVNIVCSLIYDLAPIIGYDEAKRLLKVYSDAQADQLCEEASNDKID